MIRPLDPQSDLAALHRVGSEPRVARMMQSIVPDWTMAQAAEFLERSRWRGGLGFRHAVALRSAPDVLIGTVGIGGDPVSTAYFLDPSYWGRGYATEALAAFLAVVMPRFGLSSVEAGHFEDNPASGAVLRKVGFVETARAMAQGVARDVAAQVVDYRLDLASLRVGICPVLVGTPRLTLRPVVIGDEADVVAGLNDSAVSSWLARVPFPYRAEDFRSFLENFARAGETFAIEDGVGFAGLVTCDGELGYWLTPRAQRQGSATEAAEAVLAAWFAGGGGTVVSGYFEGNGPSARVLDKLGFVEKGRGPVYCRALGVERGHVHLTLEPGAFAGRPGRASRLEA